MTASAASPDRSGTFRVEILIERKAEAERIAQFLAPPDLHLAVLYGRTNCGKTKLVRNFVMPAMPEPSYYGAAVPSLPETVESAAGPMPLRQALAQGAAVFLDDFDLLLDAGGQERMEEAGALLAALHRGEYRGKLILILQEQNLAHLLAFRSEAPGLLDQTFEITGLPIEEHIRKLGELGGDLAMRYEPQVLEWLRRDLGEFGALGSGDIAEAVDWGFRQYKYANTDRLITADDYVQAGSLAGVIRLCLKARMQTAEAVFGKGASEITEAIAEEVVEAARFNRAPEFAEIAPRLALPAALLESVLGWANADGRLLRSDPKEGVSLIPRELARVLEPEFEKRWRDLADVRKVLGDGLRARKQVDGLLARERFDQINRVREKLKTSTDETSLLALSALHYPEEHGEASYWISRLTDGDCQIDVLIEALFSESGTARLKAATLLAGFETPEVCNQLYRKALEDPEAGVRERALESLAGMDTSDLWSRIDREVKDKASPYRLNAIEAMRLCRGPEYIATLRAILTDSCAADMRGAAIRSLGAIPTPEAADALVSVALEDDDEQDRAGAAAVLAALQSTSLAARALETARTTRLRLDRAGWEIFEQPLDAARRIALSVLLAIANFFFHGAALIPLGAYRRAAAYFAIELVALGVYVGAGLAPAAPIWILNWIFSHFVATRLAMESVGRQVWNYRITRILGSVLFIFCIGSFLLLHGSAHALMGRWRRAVTLFFEQIIGIAIMVLAWYFFDDYKHGHHPIERAFYGLYFVYTALGAALFVHSFWSDFREIFFERFLMADRGEARMRKDNLVGQVLATSTGTQAALQMAEGPDPEPARWAQDTLLRPPWSVANAELLARYEAMGEGAPRFLDASIARNKTEESVTGLASLWDRTGSRPFQRRILGALISSPTQSSLREAAPRVRTADAFTRLRYQMVRNTYGLRLLPRAVVWGGAIALPFLCYALYEARQAVANPAHSLIHHMRSSFERPGGAPFGVKAALFLAENYHEEAAHDIIEVYKDTANASTRSGLLESLSVLACAPSTAGSFAELTGALNDSGSPRALLRAFTMAARRGGCVELVRVSEQLTTHGKRILDDAASAPDVVRLALRGLEAANSEDSIQALERFVSMERVVRLRATDVALIEERRDRVLELKLEAVDSLLRIGSRPAYRALDAIAREPIAPELKRQIEQRLRALPSSDPVKAVQAFYNTADYGSAIRAARAIASPAPEQQRILIPLLAQSYYRLSLESGAAAAPKQAAESEAIRYLQQALDIEFNTEMAQSLAEVHNRRAKRLRGLGEYDRALEESTRAIEADRYFADAYGTQASILRAKGGVDQALEVFAKATSTDPRYALGYCMQADIHLERKQWEAARKLAEKAIQADPGFSLSYGLLSDSYKGTNQNSEAIRRFEQLEREYPNVYWPGRQLAVLYHDSSPDPGKDLERSYEKWLELDKRFAGSLDSATLKNHKANLMESRFTAGHYGEVVAEGPSFAASAKGEPNLEIPVRLLSAAAAMMLGNQAVAAENLTAAEAAMAAGFPPGFKFTWDYTGTINHLRGVKSRPAALDAFVRLFGLVQSGRQSGEPVPPEAFAAARNAL